MDSRGLRVQQSMLESSFLLLGTTPKGLILPPEQALSGRILNHRSAASSTLNAGVPDQCVGCEPERVALL
jgi:hypothetical protein